MLYGLDLTTLADADTKLHCNAKPMRKPLVGRRGRTQWCDASARCGSKRYLCEECSAAWTASSAQRGERRTREDCHHGEREAVSEENVAENMTVPRKANRANRFDYKATAATMNDCTATATLSALSITTTRKVSPQRQLLKRKKPSIHHEPTARHINLSYL